jgi:membrane-bound serine protease (ClpP class)
MFMTRSLLAVLADPSVTYLLFVLGIIGLVGEVHHPGTLLPGIAGGLAMVLALVGFSELGINWIGLGLVLLAAALFVAEAHRPGFGLLAVAGILAFVVGSWLLFVPLPGLLPVSPVSPHPSSRAVSPWLIALSAFAISGYFLIVLCGASQRSPAPKRCSGRKGWPSRTLPSVARYAWPARTGAPLPMSGRSGRARQWK